MEAWAQILSGAKTHGLVLIALGSVIAMMQAGDISMTQAIYLGAIAGAFSTVRFAIKNNGDKK